MQYQNICRKAGGFSLIEMMIGLTLGMIVLFAVTTLVVSTSKSRQEMEKTSQQIENGRYAMQLLTDDIRHAGFFGSFNPAAVELPAAMPDPCSTALTDLVAAVPLHLQGYDLGAGAPACLTDLKPDTDILVVRRVKTCEADAADCDAFVDGQPHFQSTQCNSELSSGPNAPYYKVNTDKGQLNYKARGCAADAPRWRYVVNIYYIASNNEAGDGIPTLKRWELGDGVVALVEGIEDLQFEYGIDGSNDGIPDGYTAAPAALADWQNVMAVKISLLSRNTKETRGHQDAKEYQLGLDAGGAVQVVGPYGDQYKRHVYTGIVQAVNAAGRRT